MMAKISKKRSEWWKNHLSQVAMLVVSIGITYYADSLIKYYLEKQEDLEAIHMLKNELLSNLTELEEMQAFYRKEIKFATTYARERKNLESLPKDSVQEFYNQHRLYYFWFLKDNALDMLKESGSAQRIDKSLLIHVFECYQQIDAVRDMGEHYKEKKIMELLSYSTSIHNGQHALTADGQWKQISQDGDFEKYILNSLPLMAKSALAIEMNTERLIGDIIPLIDKMYPSD